MQVFFCFLLLTSLTLCQQSSNPSFKIAIAAGSPTVIAEGEVWIKVSQTNTSNHDLDASGSYFT